MKKGTEVILRGSTNLANILFHVRRSKHDLLHGPVHACVLDVLG